MLIKKGEKNMKCLKIEDNKGWYCVVDEVWKPIDQINKTDLMKLINRTIEDDNFSMDEFDESKIANQAHSIIYNSIYSKLTDLAKNRNSFRDESEEMYKEAIKKYSKNIE